MKDSVLFSTGLSFDIPVQQLFCNVSIDDPEHNTTDRTVCYSAYYYKGREYQMNYYNIGSISYM